MSKRLAHSGDGPEVPPRYVSPYHLLNGGGAGKLQQHSQSRYTINLLETRQPLPKKYTKLSILEISDEARNVSHQ